MMTKYHDNTGTYTNANSTATSWKFDYTLAKRKLAEIEGLPDSPVSVADLKALALKADFNVILIKALEKLYKNKQVQVNIAYTRLQEETEFDWARILLQVYDSEYCQAQDLDFFDSDNGFKVTIWPRMLTTTEESYDPVEYQGLSFEDKKVLRVARAIFDAWAQWQYDTAYEIVGGKGDARNLVGLRQYFIDLARKNEIEEKRLKKLYSGIDAKITEEIVNAALKDINQTIQLAGLAEVHPMQPDLERVNKELAKATEKNVYLDTNKFKEAYKLFSDTDNETIIKTCLGGNDDE